jgi:hypothetical protein
MGCVANYCNWLVWSVYLHQVITGTEANTTLHAEANVCGDEGVCGKNNEGKEGNSDIIEGNHICQFYLNTFIHIITEADFLQLWGSPFWFFIY